MIDGQATVLATGQDAAHPAPDMDLLAIRGARVGLGLTPRLFVQSTMLGLGVDANTTHRAGAEFFVPAHLTAACSPRVAPSLVQQYRFHCVVVTRPPDVYLALETE